VWLLPWLIQDCVVMRVRERHRQVVMGRGRAADNGASKTRRGVVVDHGHVQSSGVGIVHVHDRMGKLAWPARTTGKDDPGRHVSAGCGRLACDSGILHIWRRASCATPRPGCSTASHPPNTRSVNAGFTSRGPCLLVPATAYQALDPCPHPAPAATALALALAIRAPSSRHCARNLPQQHLVRRLGAYA
jgi:hypothetical protein